MYNEYFGFKESPFNLTPDSSFFYPSAKHKAALDALVYAIHERKGFVVLTGEIGSGKTTISRTLLKMLGSNVKTAVVTNTMITPKGILTMILEDLGVEYIRGSKERLILQLNQYLINEARRNCDVVFVIDEAQNLSMNCLEEVRMLSNLETEKEKLIQIVMLGQPELRRKLESPRLEQLRQRIVVEYHLEPLDRDETHAYILHRLNCANANGHDMTSLFDEASVDFIYRQSHGIPRRINKLCDFGLLTACLIETKTITQTLMEEAMKDFFAREENKNEHLYQSAR